MRDRKVDRVVDDHAGIRPGSAIHRAHLARDGCTSDCIADRLQAIVCQRSLQNLLRKNVAREQALIQVRIEIGPPFVGARRPIGVDPRELIEYAQVRHRLGVSDDIKTNVMIDAG